MIKEARGQPWKSEVSSLDRAAAANKNLVSVKKLVTVRG